MPFRSLQQERLAFATHQPFAKKWADMTNQKTLAKKKKKYSKRALKQMGLKSFNPNERI